MTDRSPWFTKPWINVPGDRRGVIAAASYVVVGACTLLLALVGSSNAVLTAVSFAAGLVFVALGCSSPPRSGGGGLTQSVRRSSPGDQGTHVERVTRRRFQTRTAESLAVAVAVAVAVSDFGTGERDVCCRPAGAGDLLLAAMLEEALVCGADKQTPNVTRYQPTRATSCIPLDGQALSASSTRSGHLGDPAHPAVLESFTRWTGGSS